MDQQLFTLARAPAMKELLAVTPGIELIGVADSADGGSLAADGGSLAAEVGPADIAKWGGYATSIFLIGWATGGLAFGVLGDRIGRAKTMLITILMYSAFTGLSALSVTFWDFAAYRFLTGLGIGGEFAVGISLVAEVMPARARPFALGLLQALSALGNVTASLIGMTLGHLEQTGAVGSAWRAMFVVGALPALLVIWVRRRLKEPERWQSVAQTDVKRQLGSYAELFGDPRWRKNAIVGLLLAFSGVVGLWGIGFFTPDLIRTVLDKSLDKANMTQQEIDAAMTFWASMGLLTMNIGAFFGIYAFAHVTHFTGRKPAFAVAFVMAMVSTAVTFWFLDSFSQIFWMVPIMGFCQLSLFGGYAIYFPELFPTYLRSTGTSFCYNVGRFVAASGPAALGLLTGYVYSGHPEPMRYAGVTMCAVFLLGLLVLPFAPETRGKPLPE